LVVIRQGIAGLSFPYSLILFLIFVDESLTTTITDVPKYLAIAGIVLICIALASLLKIG
jgi:hypothetical protein